MKRRRDGPSDPVCPPTKRRRFSSSPSLTSSREQVQEFEAWADSDLNDRNSNSRNELPLLPSAVCLSLASRLPSGSLSLQMLGKVSRRLQEHVLSREDEERFSLLSCIARFLAQWKRPDSEEESEEFNIREEFVRGLRHLSLSPLRCLDPGAGLPGLCDLTARKCRRTPLESIVFDDGECESVAAPTEDRNVDGVLPIARALFCSLDSRAEVFRATVFGREVERRRLVKEGCVRAACALEREIYDFTKCKNIHAYASFIKIASLGFENDETRMLARNTWLTFNPAFRPEYCPNYEEVNANLLKERYFLNPNVRRFLEILGHKKAGRDLMGTLRSDPFRCARCGGRHTRCRANFEESFCEVCCLDCRHRFKVCSEVDSV